MTRVAAVIPSIRELDDAQIDALDGADVVVVDGGGFRSPPGGRVRVLDMATQHRLLGPDIALVGHGSAACRNFGVWWCREDGYDVILNLDDDCLPEGAGHVAEYVGILTQGRDMRLVTGTAGWVSTLHAVGPDGETWYPRGFPYERRFGHAQSAAPDPEPVRPAAHVGLWTGDLDLNAVDRDTYRGDAVPDRALYATDALLPLCAMNFGVIAAWAPFAYQVPWASFGPTLGLGRYDDILGGLVTCALARTEGARVSFGPPLVRHAKKDADFLAHARAENLGNVFIGRIARLVSEAADAVGNAGETRMARALELLRRVERAGRETDMASLVTHLTATYSRWLGLFS